MTESNRHKQLKRQAAGASGRTEVQIRGHIFDAVTPRKATEIQLTITPSELRKAAVRLKASGRPQKVLQVPNNSMAKAKEAMRKVGVSGTVKNLSGTRRSSVRGTRRRR